MVVDEKILKKWIRFQPYHLEHFLYKYGYLKQKRLLDLGCGNDSVRRVRLHCGQDIVYSGLDVGDYNLNDDSKTEMNEYVVVQPEQFAETILRWENQEDIVISSHNLEHCNEPDVVLKNITRALKKGGYLYMAFPSEESVNFPKGFQGCLNFYDDPTHQKVPEWEKTINTLKENGMKIIYQSKNYQPEIMKQVGEINWDMSNEMKRVLPGIWAYFGFESIIWAKKR